MISSSFVRWRRHFDGRRGAGGRLSVRNSVGGRPFDRFYADDFGAGRGFWPLGARCADQSHAAAVELLAGIFGGAFQANLVAVEAGQGAFLAGVVNGGPGEAGVVVIEFLSASTVHLFVPEVVESCFDAVQARNRRQSAMASWRTRNSSVGEAGWRSAR